MPSFPHPLIGDDAFLYDSHDLHHGGLWRRTVTFLLQLDGFFV